MQFISPYKVLFSLCCVLIILLGVAVIFPKSGTVKIAGVKLKFLPVADVFHVKSEVRKDAAVEKLLAQIDTSSFMETDTVEVDTLVNDSVKLIKKVEERINLQVVQKMEFADEDASVLYSFFEKLKGGKKIRILHYGDSQIEGDRMTGFLRQKLQSQFGGTGVGLVIPSDFYNTTSYNITLSDGWKRYTGFINIDSKVKHKKYGVMAAFSRFTEIIPDSSIKKKELKEAWIQVGPSRLAYSNAQTYSNAKLLYGNCKDSVQLKIMNGANEIHSSFLVADKNYHTVDVALTGKASSLKYVFKGKDSPDVYAFSFEGSGGVMVDNIALRGASGTFFNKFDQSLQRQMFDDLDVELFILQFGGNVVPYLDDESEVSDYGRWLEAQMRNLKKLRPDAAIIVIGPSDMSTKQGEEFVTYPLLPKVVDAMKEAAFNSGAAYWDMYTAMGGENSMTSWVEKKLAGDDYTHFSPEGAKYLVQMFYEALMYEYGEFIKQQSSQQ